MNIITYLVSDYFPEVGYKIEKYVGKVSVFNKCSTFSCIVSFDGPQEISEDDKLKEAKRNADDICKALNEMEKNKRLASKRMRKYD